MKPSQKADQNPLQANELDDGCFDKIVLQSTIIAV